LIGIGNFSTIHRESQFIVFSYLPKPLVKDPPPPVGRLKLLLPPEEGWNEPPTPKFDRLALPTPAGARDGSMLL
jgi:hypothetical protein